MTTKRLCALALAGASLLAPTLLAQQDNGALLQALVRKKILTQQEAEEVRAELMREAAGSTAEKIKIRDSVTELSLYGDLRLRYQYDQRRTTLQPPVSDSGSLFAGNGAQRSRERFRLRLNADFKLGANLFGGVQLQTGQAADSANQTFSGGFANYNIYISRAYLGWKALDGLTFIAGKQANPFYTTDLVWDGDVNPDGLVERVEFHKFVSGKQPLELTLVAGQFFFYDNNEDALGGDASTDVWLFAGQLIGSYSFSKDVKLTVAPGYMVYTAGRLTGMQNETPFNNTDTVVTGASRNLSIITAPGDLSFKVADIKIKILWDFAYNTQGNKRGTEIYGMKGDLRKVKNSKGETVGYTGASTLTSRDNIAWLAGVQIGENKKKGDFSVFANYRQTGLTSVDPNLNDSDFAFGQLNTQGIKVGASYNLTDSCVIALTYYDARALRKDVIGGQATRDNKLAYLDSVKIFQADLNIKF